ncbi:MAG TPA: TlpA disulfide reductase family protein [Edaphocola sp.]|nr:TlpA disulfide reductase family protein [Edaphocola sp.]
MKIKIVLIVVVSVLFSSCKIENITPEIELNKVISNLNERTSISYDLDFRMKYLDYPDTTSNFAKTIIIKEKSDSLFGGYIWHSRKVDSLLDYIKYYDMNSFYIINNHNKEVIHYDPKKPIAYGFTDNFDGDLINTYFLQDRNLKKLLHDSIYKAKVSEEDGLLKLSIAYPDGDEVVNRTREIFFDKSLNTVKQIIYRAEVDDLQEYMEWNLTDVIYDSYTAEDLEERFLTITKDYKFKEYQPPSKEENLPLATGQKAVGFKGKYLTNDSSEFDLADFSDNIIILDFWYRTCPPCIKAIPQLNRIYSKYESKGLKLFGVNPIDTDSISQQLLISFHEKEDVKYPIVLIDRSISETYKVNGYPTLYIIDKKGKVAYSRLGYYEDTEREIDSVLSVIMK